MSKNLLSSVASSGKGKEYHMEECYLAYDKSIRHSNTPATRQLAADISPHAKTPTFRSVDEEFWEPQEENMPYKPICYRDYSGKIRDGCLPTATRPVIESSSSGDETISLPDENIQHRLLLKLKKVTRKTGGNKENPFWIISSGIEQCNSPAIKEIGKVEKVLVKSETEPKKACEMDSIVIESKLAFSSNISSNTKTTCRVHHEKDMPYDKGNIKDGYLPSANQPVFETISDNEIFPLVDEMKPQRLLIIFEKISRKIRGKNEPKTFWRILSGVQEEYNSKEAVEEEEKRQGPVEKRGTMKNEVKRVNNFELRKQTIVKRKAKKRLNDRMKHSMRQELHNSSQLSGAKFAASSQVINQSQERCQQGVNDYDKQLLTSVQQRLLALARSAYELESKQNVSEDDDQEEIKHSIEAMRMDLLTCRQELKNHKDLIQKEAQNYNQKLFFTMSHLYSKQIREGENEN